MDFKEENKIEIEIVETEVLETELPEEEKQVVSKTTPEIVTEEIEEKTEEKEEKKKGEFLKNPLSLSSFLLGLRLCLIVSAVVLLLAVVNFFTSPVIAQNSAEKGNIARQELVPEATAFHLYEKEIPEVGENVSEIYIAENNGEDIAYCLNISTSGFGGEISLVTAIDYDMKIRGVKVITHAETPNIGATALANDGELLSQYKNISTGNLDSVVAVSGATVSSKAVRSAIEEAVLVVNALVKGEVNG